MVEKEDLGRVADEVQETWAIGNGLKNREIWTRGWTRGWARAFLRYLNIFPNKRPNDHIFERQVPHTIPTLEE